jgi:general secretion pathway protein A
MYLQHWKLTHSPFAPRYAARHFFASPTHDEALARLQFLVDDGRRVGLLLGATGSGKTVTLEVLRRELRKSGATVALLSLLGVDEEETLWQLCASFGLNPSTGASRAWMWRSLLDFLATQRHQQRATAILFDDAHEATPDVLALVSRFLDWEQTPESRLTVVLAAMPEFAPRLGRRVLQLAELRVSLERWDSRDTADYIRAMLAAAKCEQTAFTDEALDRIHRLADGSPRRVAQLANLALLAGAGRELPQVDLETVQSVFDELSLEEVMVPR